jgi:hypothetical protein
MTEPRDSNLGISKGRSANPVRIFAEAVDIRNTPAWAYLIRRGIDVGELPGGIHDALRWHPLCPWGENGGRHACMVALYTDAVTAEPRAIHRTAITPNGEKVDRRALGPKAGCTIRLWSDDDVTSGLVVGEGIETTLAAATCISHRGTSLRPAWATGDADNLTKLQVLPGIEALTILVDHDVKQTGQNAALKCSERWTRAGREVIRLVPAVAPDVKADFNDIVAGKVAPR